MKPLGRLRPGLGVDLGTANTVVYHPRRGVILNEPSVMLAKAGAEERRSEPLATGALARELMGRTPAGLAVIRPLQDGVVTDLAAAKGFIVASLRKLRLPPWERVRARAVIGLPAGATGLERQALKEAAEEAGLGRVDLLPEPIAGALGAGVDPAGPRARMVVDVGGGTSEITAFCYGGILTSRSSRIAGDELTIALSSHLRQAHQLLVGDLAAEEAKKALAEGGEPTLVIDGRDAATGRPRSVQVEADELEEALRPTVDAIVCSLTATLAEDLPPQAVADIMKDGVIAFGGGSLMKGLACRFEQATGFRVRVAERPLTCVAEGAAAALARPDVLRSFTF